MTVSKNALKTVQSGDGAVTSFPFTFQISKLADVAVYIINSLGNATKLTSGYQVTLNDVDDLTAGGYVIYPYPTTGTKLASDEKIVVMRESDFLQETDFTNTGPFLVENIENVADRVVMQNQELEERVKRTLTANPGTEGADYTLPVPVAGKALGWNSDGTGFRNYDNPGEATVNAEASAAEAAASAVEAANSASEAAISEAKVSTSISKTNNRDMLPEIIDMHYDSLKGVGYHASEPGGEYSKKITVSATKETTAITLDSVLNLYQGQLIVIFAGDKYYSNVIQSIVGNVINLVYPLDVNVSVGDVVYNFYINASHPNKYGYKAIADETIRNLIKPRGARLIYRILPSDFIIDGSGTVADGGFIQDYTQPFATYDTKVITVASGETMIATKRIFLKSDIFLKFRTHITVGTGATLNYQISNTSDTISYYNKNKTLLGYGKPEIVEVVTYLKKGDYNFKLQSTTPGTIFIGKTEIFELSDRYDLSAFNKGTHLMLGDSWFAQDYLIARLAEKLPNATMVNFGVGGNEIDYLYRRFTGTATDADINNDLERYGDRKDATLIPNIDFVWVMCGTNDYFAHTTSVSFKSKMDNLVKEIIERGAKPLIFTASVGQPGVSTNFTLSREYADLYYNQQYSKFYGVWTPVLEGITVAGVNTYAVQTGTYYKIEKLVIVQFELTLSAKDATMSGPLQISGLPFTPASTNFAPSFAQVERLTLGSNYTQLSGFCLSKNIILIQMAGSAGFWTNLTETAVVNSTKISGSLFYITEE